MGKYWLSETCKCCNGKGWIELTFDMMPKPDRELLRALADGQERVAGELPNPGSTQRMALIRMEKRRLVTARVVDRHISHRNHRHAYTITDLGKHFVD